MASLRIGIHTSRAGSLEKSVKRAYQCGANTFQIFSASPRMWKTMPLDPEDVYLFRKARERLDLFPLSIHTSYLINLASADPVIRKKSITAFRKELERAVDLGAEFLVTHPGSCNCSSREEGLVSFGAALKDAAQGLDLGSLIVLIENTVGAGTQLGGTFSELAMLRDRAAKSCSVPVGYCLDTCHLYASGFNIATAAGLKSTVAAADREIGLDRVFLIHCNDSKGALGSRLDRHANIGEGEIGLDGFGRILRHPALRSKPFILETPDGEDFGQRRDIETLKRLAASNEKGANSANKKIAKQIENAGKAVQL